MREPSAFRLANKDLVYSSLRLSVPQRMPRLVSLEVKYDTRRILQIMNASGLIS